MPATVIRKELQKKVDEIEARDARKIYRKEKDQLKDELIQSLLPRSLTKESITYAVIAPKLGMILVDTTSTAKAEELLSMLREVLGSLPIRPVTTNLKPSATLTRWLKSGNESNDGFLVLEDCQLENAIDTKGVIRYKNQYLGDESIINHLNNGMQVTSLTLDWQAKISFTINAKLAIKRIRFDDIIFDEASKDGHDDAASQFDANFTLMMLTFSEFIPALIKALGGNE